MKSAFNCSLAALGLSASYCGCGGWAKPEYCYVMEAFSFSPASQYDNVTNKIKTVVALLGIYRFQSYVWFQLYFSHGIVAF
jgi:hypothetical protein